MSLRYTIQRIFRCHDISPGLVIGPVFLGSVDFGNFMAFQLAFQFHSTSQWKTVKNKMSEAYDVVGGSLKLKGVKDGRIKKKLVHTLYCNHGHCSTCSFIV